MKKYFVLLFLFTLLSTPGRSHAIPVSIVSEAPTTMAAWIKDFGTQTSTTISTGISAAADPITAFNQTLSTVKQTVLDPVKDALTLVTMFKNGKLVMNLVLGAAGTENAALIQNPQVYIKRVGDNAVRGQLAYISNAKGMYSQSIMRNIAESKRLDNDAQGQLQSLMHSSIPSTIQKNICDDDVRFTELANNSTESKEALYARLCNGDPNGTDPQSVQLAKTLTEVARQRPEVGGWDTWLQTTGGENAYEKEQKARILVAEAEARAKLAKEKDLEQGKGIASKTECVRYAQNDETGEKYCAEESITHLGSQLSDSFKEALNLPGNVLKQSFGSGSLISTIGSIVGTISTIAGMAQQVQGISGQVSNLTGGNGSSNGGSYTGGGNITQAQASGANSQANYSGATAGANYTGGTTNTSSVTSASAVDDIPQGSKQKSTLLNPTQAQLSSHLSTLDSLESTERSFISEIDGYIRTLDSIGSCYNSLVNDFPADSTLGFTSISTNFQVSSALSTYNAKKSEATTLRNNITNEIAKIATTKALISKTLADLNATNSSEEFSSIFTSFQNTMDTQNLVGMSTGVTRKAELLSYKNKIADETQNLPSNPEYNGILTNLLASCEPLRTAENDRRAATYMSLGYRYDSATRSWVRNVPINYNNRNNNGGVNNNNTSSGDDGGS